MSDQAVQPETSIVANAFDAVRKLDVRQLNDWFTLSLKVAGGLGGLLLVAYAAKEHFFYDLSSLAAASLLLLFAFAFSFLVVGATLYAVISFIWIVAILFWAISLFMRLLGHRPKARLRPIIAKWYVLCFSFVLFLSMTSIIIPAASRHPINYELLRWASLTGFVVVCAIAAEPLTLTSDSGMKSKWIWLIPALPVLMLPIGNGAFSYLLDRSMVLLSFRSEPSQLVSLSERSHREVDALAKSTGIQISACELGNDRWLLKGAILVWHGIGATSYLRIIGKQNASVLIPLPSSEVDAIRVSSPEVVGPCA